MASLGDNELNHISKRSPWVIIVSQKQLQYKCYFFYYNNLQNIPYLQTSSTHISVNLLCCARTGPDTAKIEYQAKRPSH